MDSKGSFDFWYAVNNTEVIVRPKQTLESFGTSTIHYHLVTEVMDQVNCISVREGKIHAYKPQIITPNGIDDSMLEGFADEEASDYLDWLKTHERELSILQYGFKIRKEAISEESVHDQVENVLERVRDELAEKDEPMHALIRGVDEPWEVCLLKLMVEMVQNSVATNAKELRLDPLGHHREIEQAFEAAAKNPSRIEEVANLLQRRNLFSEYEDRFFALVKSKGSQ